MFEKIPLIVLLGPTAVGKTSISIELAKKLDASIISADSMQIYKYMDIGTAKIKKEEMGGIKHYLVDEVHPDEDFSVADFQEKAKRCIEDVYSNGKIPMVVGGTGLYINSIVYNLDFTDANTNWELREKLYDEAKKYGNKYIYDKLVKIDPKSANRIHINDTKRLVRALEVYYETGEPMSKSYNNFRELNDSYDLAMIGMRMDRKKLYDRINKRVDIMLQEGLVEEVTNLINQGYDTKLQSLQGLGYKEIVSYLKGEYTLEEATKILKRDTRRFAKRQLTWFRRDKRIKWYDVDNYENKDNLVKDMLFYIKENLSLN